MAICETPDGAAAYWRATIATWSHFNPDIEVFAVLFLNTRRRKFTLRLRGDVDPDHGEVAVIEFEDIRAPSAGGLAERGCLLVER
jgi:hypothetical protein